MVASDQARFNFDGLFLMPTPVTSLHASCDRKAAPGRVDWTRRGGPSAEQKTGIMQAVKKAGQTVDDRIVAPGQFGERPPL